MNLEDPANNTAETDAEKSKRPPGTPMQEGTKRVCAKETPKADF
jgi:hypothetical protein